ncbi:alpha beta fold family hydrolase [Lacticaseibacillus brantae DSM 23927]|uniref:Alpha beta fold family hydrolase n=1 Tax=Lacticaseibacillus brantae DSM 23927 TaxID=1423727 RepID=A0A0R2B6S0_9LACO|nr:alpha beta fold family hydrolase [Lacticaseibacillus brantae DSM 23927]
MKRIPKWVKWTVGLVFGGFIIVLAAASLYFYQYAFVPSHKDFLSNKQTTSEKAAQTWLKQQSPATWHETAVNSDLKLDALYLPATKPTNKAVVVAHGYMNTKEDMAEYIRMFHNAGYNVLAPDDRGHGQSQGNYIGWGWPDRLDYTKWTQQVIQKLGDKSEIALFGVSMGGATVMYMSGEKLPSQVKTIVEDCGYTSIMDELGYQAKQMYNLPSFPLVPAVALTASIRTGYNVFAASSINALKKNHLPIMFIHGAKDTFVPTSMVYQNYKATSADKELWVVPGAKHAQSYGKDPKRYTQKVIGWLQQHMS